MEDIAMASSTKLMTKSATFDTPAASKDLQGAGFDRKHAEALARTMARVQRNLKTREDIANLKEATEASVANLKEANKAEFANLIKEYRKDIDRLRTTMFRFFLPIHLMVPGFMLQSYFAG